MNYLVRLFLALLWVPAALLAQDDEEDLPGYAVLGDRVVVETSDHWRAWEAPTGARLIRPDGTVEPRLLRSQVNAVFSAESDSILARVTTRSNPEDAQLIVDGDPQTFWEPDPADDLSQWTLDLDLGQTLVAERLVLCFVEEGEGDPFRQFRVLVSDGLGAAGRSGEKVFARVGLVNNLDGQRQFSFALEPQRKVAEGITGAIVQHVRLDVLDTEGPRAAEVTPEDYQALSQADQGAIDYFLRTSSGRQIGVSQNTYQNLPAEEKGPVRYFRRERPRLAEVEVFALGENIVSITQAEQEREALKLGKYDFLLFRTFTDGLFSTNKDMLFYDPVQDENQVEIDLGAKYWLDRVKLLSPDRPPLAYQVRISDGTIDPAGNRVWTTFEERQNLERFLHVEEQFPRREVRYIEVRQLQFSGSRFEKGRLSEIQAYGEGYVSEITMTSPFIRLDRPQLFTRLTWEGEAPPNTRIEVQTRTGEKVTLVPHYFTKQGREISEDLWRRLPEPDRPPPQLEEVTGPDWSNWSPVYARSGEAFKSPSPRPLVKVQVRLLSAEPLQRAWLRGLHLHFVPPLVDVALGEIWPVGGVEPGAAREFTLYLKPVFGPGNPGFDRLSLRSSSSEPLELVWVRAGQDPELGLGSGTELWPSGPLQVERGQEGAVEISFPEPVASGSSVLAFGFRTRLFLQSTTFSGRLHRASRPGLFQDIVAGDATSLVATQSLSVVSQLKESSLLENFSVVPPVFTPNSDGVNDQAQVRLTVFHLERGKTLHVEVLDLSGHRVRDLSVQSAFPSGEHALFWDGRDQRGALLAPGLYLVRVHFDTDSRGRATSAARLVHLVY